MYQRIGILAVVVFGFFFAAKAATSSTVFEATFENENWFSDFHKYKMADVVWGKERCERVLDPERKGHVLKVRFLPNEIGPKKGGAYWRVYLPKTFSRIKISYDLKFDPSFDFVKGGKLPGLAAGGTVENPQNPTATFGRPTGKEGWSMRVMWRENGRGLNYVYHAEQPGDYGHNLWWKTGNGTDAQEVKFERGKWHHLETEVVLNDPDKSNGIVRTWLDGQQVLDYPKIRNRIVTGLEADSLYFDTYFGGPDDTWAPPKDEFLYLDNVKITSF